MRLSSAGWIDLFFFGGGHAFVCMFLRALDLGLGSVRPRSRRVFWGFGSSSLLLAPSVFSSFIFPQEYDMCHRFSFGVLVWPFFC